MKRNPVYLVIFFVFAVAAIFIVAFAVNTNQSPENTDASAANFTYFAGRWNNYKNNFTIGQQDVNSGLFYLSDQNTNDLTNKSFVYGNPGWKAIAGDWDGDGVFSIGAFDAATGTFYLRNSNTTGTADIKFIYQPFKTDKNIVAIAGDWDGDQKYDVGLYQKGTGTFKLYNTVTNKEISSFTFGDPNMIPLAGDWDGIGKSSVGVYNPTTGFFFLKNYSDNKELTRFIFGNPNWIPVMGDWQGNKKMTAAVIDPAKSKVYIRNTNTTGVSDSDFTLTTRAENKAFKYFGYYNLDGVTFNSANFVQESKNNSNANVGHIFVDAANISAITPLLKSFHDNNMKAIINVQWLFFDSAGVYNQNNAVLRKDDKGKFNPAYWNNFKTTIAPYINDIYGFYFDEPIYNGMTETDFVFATKTIKDAYSQKAVMAIEAGFVVNENKVTKSYIANLTDYGFDYYFTDPVYRISFNDYKAAMQKLITVAGNKKIWLVPEGYVKDGNTAMLRDAWDKYYTIAKTNSQVVGMLMFTYPEIGEFGTTLKTIFNGNLNCSAKDASLTLKRTNTVDNCLPSKLAFFGLDRQNNK